MKAVAGANGHFVEVAKEYLRQLGKTPTICEFFKICQDAQLAYLIVMDDRGNVLGDEYAMEDVGPLHDLYYSKFGDPEFNPRWDNGTAEHVEIVTI